MTATRTSRCAGLAVILLLIVSAAASALTEDRISVLYLHRSVGKSIVENCLDPRYGPRNIRVVLDTMNVTVGDHKARFVFRSGNLNGIDGPPVTETTYTGTCGEVPVTAMYDGNTTKIWYNNSCPLLELFSDTSKNNAIRDGTLGKHMWDVFRTHRIRTSATDASDTAWEKYDLVITKQPYLLWVGFPADRAPLIKEFYRAVRDSVKNHPELNFAVAFGTPLCYDELGDLDFNSDTTIAKRVYQLAIWFRDSLDVPDVPNFWAFDCYTSLCETRHVANRYCLRDDYWGGPTAQSHLSGLGAAVAQDTLTSFIRRASASILAQRSGVITPEDIDRKIKAFREGTATVQEVLDLINRYNNGQ